MAERKPLPGALVIQALRVMDAEARKRGEMFPQTADEQREDSRAVRNVIASLEFYTSPRQSTPDGWPMVKDWPALPEPEPAAPPSGLHESAQAVEPEWFISPTRVPLREGYFYTQAQMYDLTWGPEIRLWWNGQSWRTCAIGRYRFDMHRRWRASPPPGSVDTAAAPAQPQGAK